MKEFENLGSYWPRRSMISGVSLTRAYGTLSAAVGEESDTIEDVVEPYLLQLGLLQRTPRGRVATERAYRHLGVSPDGVPLT